MKKKNIYIASLLLSGLVSCSQEAPFKIEKEETGKVLTSAFSLEIEGTTPITKALTNGVPSPSDFKVEFFSKNDESQAYRTYDTYGSMPEIVELPAGTYYIKASYGGTYGNGQESAAFNAPYYLGVSEDFNIEVDKIVSNIENVVCKLSNVRVKVNFDTSLASKMSPDSKVMVRVGGGTTLDYTINTKDDGFFFLQPDASIMTATFKGEVEGDNIEEGKTYTDIKNGLYYILTFKLHSPDASDPGNIVPGDGNGGDGLVIDTDVTVADMGDHDITDINPGNDNNGYLEDDMRPENGENSGDTENPGNNNPGTPPSGEDNPTIPSEGQKPEIVGDGVVLDQENIITEDMKCILYIISDSEITNFMVYISSDDPNFMLQLGSMLGEELDLLSLDKNDNDKGFSLSRMGFPVGEDIKNPTEYDEDGNAKIKFEISDTLLSILRESYYGCHKFKLSVTNDSGNTEKTLILRSN